MSIIGLGAASSSPNSNVNGKLVCAGAISFIFSSAFTRLCACLALVGLRLEPVDEALQVRHRPLRFPYALCCARRISNWL